MRNASMALVLEGFAGTGNHKVPFPGYVLHGPAMRNHVSLIHLTGR